MDKIIISSDVFDEIKEACKPHVKDNCKYCGCKIDKNSFGLLTKDITCCKSMVCITESLMQEDSEFINKASLEVEDES